MSPFSILGIPSNASVAVANKAYRKLAMLHHPDRGGSEAKFKEIKAAFEQIEAGFREPTKTYSYTWEAPQSPENAWYERKTPNEHYWDSIYKENQSYHEPQPGAELVVNVGIREAFVGFCVIIKSHRGTPKSTVVIPPGLPDGYRGKYTASDGSVVVIILRIQTGDFYLRGLNDTDLFSPGLNIGDIEVKHQIDAIDLITGTWVKIKDFHGEELTVRVPAGFNPLHRLKVAEKGYFYWLQEYSRPSNVRASMYIQLIPIFNKPEDIERQKIIDLYKSIQDAS